MLKKLAIPLSAIVVGVTGILTVLGITSYRYFVIPAQIAELSLDSGKVLLSFNPNNVTLAPNAETEIPLVMDTTDAKATIVAAELTYDPGIISVISVTQGSFLTNSLSAAKIEAGKINFTYGAPYDSGGTAGSGTLATIKIKALTNQETKLVFTANTQALVIVGGVAVQTNSVKSAQDLTINPPAASPAPAASPLASPEPSASPQTQASASPQAQASASPAAAASPSPQASASPRASTAPRPSVSPGVQPLPSRSPSLPPKIAASSPTPIAKNTFTDSSIPESNIALAETPNLWQQILLGWQAILNQIIARFQ